MAMPHIFNNPGGKSVKREELASDAVRKSIVPGKKDIFQVVVVGIR